MKELNQIQEALSQNREKIERCENFQFPVKKSYKEKVPIVNEWWWNSNETCCSVCEENCHEWECSMAKDASWCWVMKDNHCTVCKGKCHYNKHVRERKKYVTKIKDVIMTFDELKQEYEGTGEKSKMSIDKTKYEDTKEQHERD